MVPVKGIVSFSLARMGNVLVEVVVVFCLVVVVVVSRRRGLRGLMVRRCAIYRPD